MPRPGAAPKLTNVVEACSCTNKSPQIRIDITDSGLEIYEFCKEFFHWPVSRSPTT